MWRPEGWDKIVKDNVSREGGYFNPHTPIIIETDRLLFEAGADAMLEALKKDTINADYCEAGQWMESVGVVDNGTVEGGDIAGWWVFIPE